MPLFGPSSRIQPLISSTEGIRIGASVNRSANERSRESVRSISQARNPPMTSTRLAVDAAYTAERHNADQILGRAYA